MKKIVAIIIALAAIITLVPMTAKADTVEHHLYAKTAVVIELDYDSDTVVLSDGAENLWAFYGIEDWQIDDFASMLMDDNGTPDTIYDDIIVEVTYAGTFDFTR